MNVIKNTFSLRISYLLYCDYAILYFCKNSLNLPPLKQPPKIHFPLRNQNFLTLPSQQIFIWNVYPSPSFRRESGCIPRFISTHCQNRFTGNTWWQCQHEKNYKKFCKCAFDYKIHKIMFLIETSIVALRNYYNQYNFWQQHFFILYGYLF